MQKYVSILDQKTLCVLFISVAFAYVCLQYGYRSSVNITLFSLAVIFPLVFTIREAFKRRDNAIQLLSAFKASLTAAYFCFQSNRKLDIEGKKYISGQLEQLSSMLFATLYSDKSKFNSVREKMDEIFFFVSERQEYFSSSTAMKLFRILKDAKESMENIFGLSTHGTPVSLRAYCLVFIYAFPLIFIPALVNQISSYANWVIYLVSATPGFILVTLYNIQERMEDPFDQSGLDDIKIEEFDFRLPTNSTTIRHDATVTDLEFGQLPNLPPVGQFATRDSVQM
ncbi:MAG: hypothetical protein MI746_07705 [Pseudomonadales bacterium]|nr:hypothetical protein [Pseudomonadales bacterium]